MIEIILDQFKILSASQQDIVVHAPQQYEGTLDRIKDAANSNSDLRIIVRNPALFHWYDSPSRQYGCKPNELRPTSELCRILGTPSLPSYLEENPSWIIENELLRIANKNSLQPNESAESWLRRALFGIDWSAVGNSSKEKQSHVLELLLKYSDTDLHELKRELLLRQIQTWIQAGTAISLWSWILESPFERVKFLAWEKTLSHFPEDKISAWLQQNDVWYTLSLCPERNQFPTDQLRVENLPESIGGFVRSFLEDKWRESQEDALEYLTGSLAIERRFLTTSLEQQLREGAPLSPLVLKKLTEFSSFPEVTSLAQQLTQAKAPKDLLPEFEVEQVQSWLKEEYLPFYNSCALLNTLKDTERYLTQFEKWLKDNYPSLLISGEGMAYRNFRNIKERLSNGPVLLYVFDGLDYICAETTLLPALRNRGYTVNDDPTPYLSFLPTKTFIAKPPLVCGWMKSQIPTEPASAEYYKSLTQKALNLKAEEITVATDKTTSIEELITTPAKVYLYLDNHLDSELLHSNIPEFIRRKKYKEHVVRRVSEITKSANLYQEIYGSPLQITICSDHGYTLIPKDVKPIQIPNEASYKARYLENFDTIELPTDSEQIWKLQPGLYGINNDMAVPAGYNCFRKRPLGATHGGATPQEMAVGWFDLYLGTPEPTKPLSFTLNGSIFRKRKENSLSISILNPNNYTITITGLQVDGNDLSGQIPLRIPKEGEKRVETDYDASACSENFVKITINYSTNSISGIFSNQALLTVQTTGAITNEFDDDFDI